MKPSKQLFKFQDPVTALQFRQDGNLLLTGTSAGRVQVNELNNKFVLRTYNEHANRINCLAFSADNRHFISCGNETAIKLYDIQNSGSESDLSILAAHSDNIKRVSYLNDTTILSGSSDGTVKVWDLRQTNQAVSSLKLKTAVEDYCLRSASQMVIAHGNSLSVAEIGADLSL